MKAVLLYIEYENSAADVIRELGYPDRKSLVRWYKKYMTELETGVIYEGYKKRPKYSNQEKETAVNYFMEHGRNYTRTVRKLGYPSRETLRQWVDEFVPNTRKHRAYSVQYSQEQKIEAIAALCARSKSAQTVAKEQGVTRTCLYRWKRSLYGEEKHKLKPNPPNKDLKKEKDKLLNELESVRKDLYRAKIEVAVLEKTAELIKKDPGIDPKNLTNKEKTILIDALKNKYPLQLLLKIMKISRSSYYYQRSAISIPDKYAFVRELVKKSFESSGRCYGYRRIYGEIIRTIGIISVKVIRRIMKEEGLIVYCKKQRRYNSYEGEINPSAPNLIERNFHTDRPNRKWLTDITEFHIPAGKVYLSPIVDCFDGLIPSWTIGTHPDAELVNTMLDYAITTLSEDDKPIVHSDRGAHYRWPGWLSRMEQANLERSMSKKGCSPDNSACEGFFGRLKNEMFYNNSWFGVSIEEFIEILNRYIVWYNKKRIKMSLGAMSPWEYRQSLGLIV